MYKQYSYSLVGCCDVALVWLPTHGHVNVRYIIDISIL